MYDLCLQFSNNLYMKKKIKRLFPLFFNIIGKENAICQIWRCQDQSYLALNFFKEKRKREIGGGGQREKS